MTDAQSLQKQYMQLKQKIIDRVKSLETELYDPNQTVPTILAQSSYPSLRNFNDCHTNIKYPLQTLNRTNSISKSNQSFEYYKAVKNQFSEILEENLRVQREISSSLNKINENLIKQMEKSRNASQSYCNCRKHVHLSNKNRETEKSFVNVSTLNINSLSNHSKNSKLYSINNRMWQEKRNPDNVRSKSKSNKKTYKNNSNRYNAEYFNLEQNTRQQFDLSTHHKYRNVSTKNRKPSKSSKKLGNQKSRQKCQGPFDAHSHKKRKQTLGAVSKNFFENYGKE